MFLTIASSIHFCIKVGHGYSREEYIHPIGLYFSTGIPSNVIARESSSILKLATVFRVDEIHIPDTATVRNLEEFLPQIPTL